MNTEQAKPSLRSYLEQRIKELNKADEFFCKQRWDCSNSTPIEKALAREESNKVTFARQELETVLKLLEETTELEKREEFHSKIKQK